MDPIKVDFTGKGKSKELLIPPEKAGLKIVINIVITVIVAIVAYYMLLPAMNPKALEFYYYFGIILAAYVVSAFITSKAFAKPEYMPYVKKQATVPVIIALALGLLLGVGYLTSNVVFRAKAFSRIISEQPIASTNFDELDLIDSLDDFSKVPLIDKSVAEALADKTLGDLFSSNADTENLVSQFVVDDLHSTQINYQKAPTRVFPLKYGDFFKWFKNRADGLPGYIAVDMYTQEASMVRKEGSAVKYSPAEYFNRKLIRHLRFAYPTVMFGTSSFEINEEGQPYWICEIIDKTVGLIGGDDVVGVVLVNAYTGDCSRYSLDDIKNNGELKWIDQVFDAELLNTQYNYYGKYSNGFINSIIGQENVKITTSGSNFLAINDDVYMYTGVTSISNDQSIIGFILINQRTKDAKFYPVSGATEAAAQTSAKGSVQDMGWDATFPLLLNVGGEPTYFMAYTSGGVVKGYSMVNVSQYAIVAKSNNSPNLVECLRSYETLLGKNLNIDYTVDVAIPDGSGSTETPVVQTESITGVIAEIRTAVIGGNSMYYIKLDNNKYYSISASAAQNVVIFNVGDTIKITYSPTSEVIIPATNAELSVAQ